MKNIIEIEKLTVVFNENTPSECVVFDNYSVSFVDGINVILGGNGSGKSTLLKVLLGQVPIKTGQILVHGTDISKWSSLQRTKYFTAVHQDAMLGTCPSLSICDNFNLTESSYWWSPVPCRFTLSERQKTRIKQMGLPLDNRGAEKVNILSGGQRQVIAICLAFEKYKSILLLDEFTSALDEETEKKVIKFTIEQASVRNTTIVMITHDFASWNIENANIINL